MLFSATSTSSSPPPLSLIPEFASSFLYLDSSLCSTWFQTLKTQRMRPQILRWKPKKGPVGTKTRLIGGALQVSNTCKRCRVHIFCVSSNLIYEVMVKMIPHHWQINTTSEAEVHGKQCFCNLVCFCFSGYTSGLFSAFVFPIFYDMSNCSLRGWSLYHRSFSVHLLTSMWL